MAPSVRVRRAGLVAAALASVFLLSGCNPSGEAAENFPGHPVAEEAEAVDVEEGADEAGDEGEADEEEAEEFDPMEPNDEPVAIWWAEGGQIAVTISGSSSCPVVGKAIRVLEPAGEGNRVAIDLVQRPEDEICTMDFVPHTTLFWTPTDVTTIEPLIVEVAGFEVEVPVK
jgi:hypothetical protein